MTYQESPSWGWIFAIAAAVVVTVMVMVYELIPRLVPGYLVRVTQGAYVGTLLVIVMVGIYMIARP